MGKWFSIGSSNTKTCISALIFVLLIIDYPRSVYLAVLPHLRIRSLGGFNRIYKQEFNTTWNSTNLGSIWSATTHTLTDSEGAGRSEKVTDSDLISECMSRPLSPKLWMELEMNEFLRNYPGGESLNLPQLADKANLTNFDCGIEKLCYADQLCQPVRGKEWYILVAAQEWNSFMNAAYRAIGWAMTMMQGVAPSMVADFYPDCSDTWAVIKGMMTFLTAVTKVIPTEGLLSNPKWWYQLIQGDFGLFTGIANLMDDVIGKNPINQHDKWTLFSYTLSKNQDLAQMAIANVSQSIIESGISTDKGIYRILKDGNFLLSHSTTHGKPHNGSNNFAGDKQREMKASIQLHLLASIWEKQHYFITRGSDPCTDSGPNGAWKGDKVLSYCGPDNVMMNIIQAKGKHAIKKVHNARLVTAKYNLTVAFLTESAWNCQQKSGVEFDVWSATDPVKFDDQCSFNLPVCDLTRSDIRAYRDSGAGTVAACRVVGGLPI